MAGKPPIDGLPLSWFNRHSEEVVEELWKESKDSCLFLRRRQAQLYREFAEFWKQTPICSSWTVEAISPLFNVPAFCYTIPPPVQDNFSVPPFIWIDEASPEWIKSAANPPETDNKDPFNLVQIERTLAISISRWLRIGFKDDLPHINQMQQQKDLATVFQQHRQLCDLVDIQARKLTLEPLPEDGYGNPSRWEKTRTMNPVLSPVSYSILLVVTERSLHQERRVVLILTGDNAHMLSMPPTFAGIPESEVFARRGDNIIEVSLATAVRYLRFLDTEEERVNDELRNATKTRSEKLSLQFREEAREFVRRWLAQSPSFSHSLSKCQFERAVGKVLEAEEAQRVTEMEGIPEQC
ncbi:hypothetical protein LTR27_009762 [Elasticomyces elasticus]|nr:hypothetical protein LTR27_009762 [Elasticomyces elasticus]